MNRLISTVSTTVLSAAFAITAFSTAAHAQNATNSGSGVLRPPTGVTKIVSVDAHGFLIIETEDAPDAPRQYSLIIPRHIYSGGLARLFGGTSIPTEMMVSPGIAGRGLAAPGAITPMANYGNARNSNVNPYGNNPLNGGNPYGTNRYGTINPVTQPAYGNPYGTPQPYIQQPNIAQPFIH